MMDGRAGLSKSMDPPARHGWCGREVTSTCGRRVTADSLSGTSVLECGRPLYFSLAPRASVPHYVINIHGISWDRVQFQLVKSPRNTHGKPNRLGLGPGPREGRARLLPVWWVGMRVVVVSGVSELEGVCVGGLLACWRLHGD